MTQPAAALRFFLGGRDLEMVEIRRLLETHQARLHDKGLAWGAKLSTYREELVAALAGGETPVLVELADDLSPNAFDRAEVIEIDHHGERAGDDAPTSLEQVFALLALPPERWTRRLALVAANDRGHVAEMEALGVTRAEIASIRTEDRRAQGVNEADEAEARRAVAARRPLPGLVRVDVASATSSAVADFMLPALGGPGYSNLLVVMPGKLAFFGDGAMVQVLADAHPGSWWGGALPDCGFWGLAGDSVSRAAAIGLAERLAHERQT